METLEEAILRLAPRLDLLHDCLGLGKFAEIAMTSDGYFLARAWGDCGVTIAPICGVDIFWCCPYLGSRRRLKGLVKSLAGPK